MTIATRKRKRAHAKMVRYRREKFRERSRARMNEMLKALESFESFVPSIDVLTTGFIKPDYVMPADRYSFVVNK